MVDQFFFGPSDRIIPYAEPSHSLDGEAEAYIEANGATLGDSSLPDPFPSYVFSLFLLLLSRPTHNLHVNFETIRRERSLSFLSFFPGDNHLFCLSFIFPGILFARRIEGTKLFKFSIYHADWLKVSSRNVYLLR